jgi:hypothetical protein
MTLIRISIDMYHLIQTYDADTDEFVSKQSNMYQFHNREDPYLMLKCHVSIVYGIC